MKVRFLFAWLLSSIFITAHAQKSSSVDFRPFAQEGKIWKMQIGEIMENHYDYCITGDTLINGESWKNVYCVSGMLKPVYFYYAAIRDVGKKVYAIAKGSNRPRLLYDFGLKKGDLVKCGVESNAFGCILDKGEQPDTLLGFPYVGYLSLETIDTINARGLQHRRFTFTLLDAYKEPYRNEEEGIIGNVVWIEGVGSVSWPFSPWLPFPPMWSLILSCWADGNCIFASPDLYEDDETDAVSSTLFKFDLPIGSFNLQGHRLMEQSRKGVYIREGRKIVVK